MNHTFNNRYRFKFSDGVLAVVFLIAVTGFILFDRPLNYQDELKELTSDTSETYREIRKNGYVIKIHYLPMRYFELRQLMALPDSATSDECDNAIRQAHAMYGDGIYFQITLGSEDGKRDIEYEKIGNFGEYSSQLRKFLFEMDEYIYLETDQESEIRMSLYDFERTFGYTKDRKMIAVFPGSVNDHKITDSKSVKLHFREFGFGIGKQVLEWDSDNMY